MARRTAASARRRRRPAARRRRPRARSARHQRHRRARLRPRHDGRLRRGRGFDRGRDPVQPHCAEGRRRRAAGLAIRRNACAWRSRAHHDRRADAGRQRRGAPCRIRRSRRRGASAASRDGDRRDLRPSRPARTSAIAARTSSPARRCSSAGRVLRPQDRRRHELDRARPRAVSSGGRASGSSSPATSFSRPARGRTASRSPMPTDRCSRRSPSATARSSTSPGWCATTPTRSSRWRLQADADIVIVSGGSSVGIEDLAPTLVAAHGELAVHGIAMRPSSPTGMGTHRPAAGLPAARQSGLGALRLRLLRRPRDSRARRPARGSGHIDAVRAHARPQDQLADRPPGLRARAIRGRARRAALRRRRLGAVLDDEGRRLRHRRRRQRRLRCRQSKSTSGSMREPPLPRLGGRQSSFSRSSIATRPSGASARRSISHRAASSRSRSTRRSGASSPPMCVARGRAVVRSLERRRLRGDRRRHVRRVGRSPALRPPRRRSDSHRRRAGDDRPTRARPSPSRPAA